MNYDFTASATAGFATGGAAHVFDLYAETVPSEDKQSMLNKNILVETKKADHTTAASGDKSFDLNLDPARKLRQLFVHCYEAGVCEGVDITDMILQVNGEYDHTGKWGTQQKINARDCNLQWSEDIYTYATTTDDEIWSRVPSPVATVSAYDTASEDSFLGNVGDKITISGQTAADNTLLNIRSRVIPGLIVYDFDKDGYGRNLLDLAGVKDLDIVLTQGGADAAVQIVEQHCMKPFGL
jgi:hypothetical protein